LFPAHARRVIAPGAGPFPAGADAGRPRQLHLYMAFAASSRH